MNDEELIREHLAGDERAFGELVARHLKAVYSFAVHFTGDILEAEDIAQETFVKVWKSLSGYRPTDSKFKTWLMRIARNSAIDHLRKKKHIPFSAFLDEEGESVFEDIPDESPDAETLLHEIYEARELAASLEQLPARYREVVLLYYGGDTTFEEVAQVLEIPVNTAKSRHRRAVQALQKLYRDRK